MIPFTLMWTELQRLSKVNTPIVLYCVQPFTTNLINSNLPMFKYCWAWKKSKASNFPHAPNMPLKILEDVAVFSKGVVGHISQAGTRRMKYNPQGIRPGTTVVKQKPNTSEHKFHRESQTQHKAGYTCKNEAYPTVLLEFKSENGKHPTQKPVTLSEYLIKTYTDEGDTVLDFTMGSGTTGVAAVNLNRRFIGIELHEEYFQIAQDRIRRAQIERDMETW